MTEIRTAPTARAARASVVACFVAQDEDEQPVIGRDLTALADAADVDMAAALEALHITGAVDQVGRVPVRLDDATVLVLAVGVGGQDDADADALRRGAAAAAKQATRDATLAVVVPGDIVVDVDATVAARAVAEGAGLGAYAYTTYRTKNHDAVRLDGIVVVPGEGVDGDRVEHGVATARAIVEATSITRDLINTPPAFKRPPDLADRVVSLLADTPVTARVLAADELEEGGFGGLLGVGRGSSTEPRLVELTYAGTGDGDAGTHIVLVGKGITFDSGGLSLKPSASMSTMKSDMSGAAAVVGAVLAAARLEVAPRITGLLALAENMPGGDATRVSDVLTHRNGTTVEVMNTDAEGRLVLADALAYGVELEPDAMIDLATLTGGQIVALGNRIAALMGSDDGLLDALEDAAGRAGERVWRMPLPADYRDQLRSEVADLRNIGKPREAQSIVAALFLSEFVGDVPWAHLDIAGPAFSDSGDGPLVPKGATGFGVRTITSYLEALS
jgi:leucyl aminopeptidase